MRDLFVDKLKGYACFLVVFGHVIMGIRLAGITIPYVFYIAEKFIWSYHVPLFLFLSGYVYKITGEWKSKTTRAAFIKHKIINLGVPYIVFSALYVLINSFAGEVNTQFAPTDILLIWKQPIAQYWFLYALLFLFVIWAVLSIKMKNWQITLLTVSLAYIVPIFGLDFNAFNVVFSSAAAFGLGTLADMRLLKKGNIFVILFHAALGFALAYYNWIDKPIVKELMMIFGIYSSICFISLFDKCKPVGNILGFMNKYSFPIYLLHTIFTAGIRVILLRFGVHQWFVHIIFGCLFGIGISVLSAIIADKTIILNFFFFPTQTIKKLKKNN